MRITATNIEWETDGNEVDLPNELVILDEGDIAETLSEEMGWLVKSYEIKVEDD